MPATPSEPRPDTSQPNTSQPDTPTTGSSVWRRFRGLTYADPATGLRIDASDLGVPDDFFRQPPAPLAQRLDAAFDALEAIEAGAVANVDEERRVGHYWLRAPDLAPDGALRAAIEGAQHQVAEVAARVLDGRLAAPDGSPFTDFLLIGIGGSALGPQLLIDALGDPAPREATDEILDQQSGSAARLAMHVFDNTDPDGMDRVLRQIGDRLSTTLLVVISKSGSTVETRNGLLRAEAALAARDLPLAGFAVAITGEGSALDQRAAAEGWLARLPMWPWVGGRTSVTSAVGLFPAALGGLDWRALLAGACATDTLTRRRDAKENPAAFLALAWHHASGGVGAKDMVVLPYKDRLLLFSRYLQQLVMESLGKRLDRQGRVVHQGLTVYGNKGSTDQHAYVQQLREGVENIFVTFLEVLDAGGDDLEIEPGTTINDSLRGFYLGTRAALAEAGRPSLTVTIPRIDAFGLGQLIALYERAVGLYAELIDINAYHQPGVEAGKKAATEILELQRRAVAALDAAPEPLDAPSLAARLGTPERAPQLFVVLEGLAANGRLERIGGDEDPLIARYDTPPA